MTTSVVLLGTGTPRTELDRSGPSTAVVVDDHAYIFDFGPGVGGRIARAHHLGNAGMAFSKITTAFLTHHHSDHTSGLPDLFLTSWMFQRDQPLHVFGPLGTEGMCRAIRSAYALDIAKRTQFEPHAPHGDELIGHDIAPGVVFRDDRVTVEAFDVPHGEWASVHGPHPTLGYRVTTGDRVVIVSGDTTYHDGMLDLYADADVIVHEVFSTVGLEGRPVEWQAYHRATHTSATDLGRVAAAVQPGVVALTHQLLWHAAPEDVMAEISAEYSGEVAYGTDLMEI